MTLLLSLKATFGETLVLQVSLPISEEGDYRWRERECLTWLEQNRRQDEPWLAIDDLAYWFSFPCRNLYLVNYETGLIEQDVAAIVSKIRALRED